MWWGPESIAEHLKNQSYKDIQGCSPPRNRGQGWLFQATKEGSKEENTVTLSGGITLMVRKWTPKKTTTEPETQLKSLSGWTKRPAAPVKKEP